MFILILKELIRIASRLCYVDSSGNIRQVQEFTGHSVGLGCNVAYDIKNDSSPIEYSKQKLFGVYNGRRRNSVS
jgi:hypothetical protein